MDNYNYAKCCKNCGNVWDKINCDDENEKHCGKLNKTVDSFMVCDLFYKYLECEEE